MPRGRPRRSAAERRYLPADRRRRASIHSPPAALVSVDFFENITTSASTTPTATDLETSPAGEHRRWDVGLPANWSTASLRKRIEERGIKLPTGIKKAQLVRIYKDNFHNTNEGGETTYNQPKPDASVSTVRARPPPPSPPVTRSSVAADLNGIATRARQRHQPTGSNVFLSGGSQILAQTSPNNATTTECDLPQPSSASISSVEPLADVVRALQSSVSAMTTQMREIIAARHPSDGPGTARASTAPLSSLTLAARTDADTPAAMDTSVPPRGNGTYTLTTAMTSIERATEKSL